MLNSLLARPPEAATQTAHRADAQVRLRSLHRRPQRISLRSPPKSARRQQRWMDLFQTTSRLFLLSTRRLGHNMIKVKNSDTNQGSNTMAEKKPAKKKMQKSVKSTTPAGKVTKGFTEEERAAMREYAQERNAEARPGSVARKAGEDSA